jgi:hypothetical protein
MVRGGESSGKAALLFASRRVSKGVGVDGLRDSLAKYGSRTDVDVKKKVKGWRCIASLT